MHAVLSGRKISMVAQNCGGCPGAGPAARLGSRHYLDLGLGYEFSDSKTIRLGINSFTDTTAPLIGDASISNNTDDLLYDVFGRSYYLSLSARLFQ